MNLTPLNISLKSFRFLYRSRIFAAAFEKTLLDDLVKTLATLCL
jgi:hypothetical protein